MYYCKNLNSQGYMGVHRILYDNESENEWSVMVWTGFIWLGSGCFEHSNEPWAPKTGIHFLTGWELLTKSVS